MAKLHHRQMSTSHLWFASASTLGQFLHSSSIKAHICNKAGSKCEQEDDRVHQLAINTDLSWINSYVLLKWLEDAYDSYTRDIIDFLVACWARNIVVILLPAKKGGQGDVWGLAPERVTGDGELMPKSKSLKEICLFLLDPAVMDIEEQAPATPSPQVATEDFLTPRNLRILRATLMARNALLEKQLANVRNALALDKATRGKGEDEFAVRKAEEEKARRKRKRTARFGRNRAESNAVRGCIPGPSGIS
ncbi:hypothetical protein AYX14_05937 [Cryptococcus neoformans]|nr:hypothetical protein AYX15_04992 [Cryptococcus neoformans var. grubii]OWZ66520.1 hypothetical protein AYX14_05937 [Cryptococcus neoformans var. grubii]